MGNTLLDCLGGVGVESGGRNLPDSNYVKEERRDVPAAPLYRCTRKTQKSVLEQPGAPSWQIFF